MHRNDLISNNATLNKESVKEDDINSMDIFERCRHLNLNPVLLACHFQYRVEAFFKVIVVDDPLGKIKNHAIRVELQVLGNPHNHLFLWIIDAAVLSKANTDHYIKFIDSFIQAFVPNPVKNSKLFHLVTAYQVHSHSKSCRKYKDDRCRYHFGKFYTNHTIISLPLQQDLPEDQRNSIINERERTRTTVKQYIDSNLDPRRKTILNPFKENFEKVSSIQNIVMELNIINELQSDSDFQIHIKREPNACFINNFFIEGLQVWK